MKRMTPVSKERFAAILDAYGADPKRWPKAERAAAMAFMDAGAESDLVTLAKETDSWLNMLALADQVHDGGDLALHGRILAGMVRAKPENVVPLRPKPVKDLSLIWVASLGVAACIAGAIFGVNLSWQGLDDVRAQTVLEQVAMIDGDN